MRPLLLHTTLRQVGRSYFSWATVPAAVAFIVLAAVAIFADHQNRVLSDQALRSEVTSQLNLIRAKLEGNINANLQLVRGLVAVIATEPSMNQLRFSQLAERLFQDRGQLRNITAAPGFVISLLYPMEGNEKALGLDYRQDPQQREAALRARDSHELVLAGPVNLRQGGQGFVGRFPVFLDRDKPESFWGIVSAVIDMERLYRDSGLLDPNLTIEVALIGKDAMGRRGRQFYGDSRTVSDNPVQANVFLPTGSWQIVAIPKGGWGVTPSNAWLLRAMMLSACALVVVPILVAGRLMGERQKYYRDLRTSEQKLRRLSQRLELALDASKIGVWEHDLETNVLWWDDRVNELYGKPADGKPRVSEDWSATIHPDDQDRAKQDFQKGSVSGHYSSEYRLLLPTGEIRHVRARAVTYHDADGAAKMIGAEWDVTADVALTTEMKQATTLAETRYHELEAAKARIEHNALHDALTGLPNRRYLDEVLEGYALTRTDTGSTRALLHIDLDRFKQINDTLGHAAGDAMLIHVSKLLQSTVRPSDFVARIGGDEFVVVCSDDDAANMLADRIIQQMRQPVSYLSHQCRFGVSIGIAVDHGKTLEPTQLMVNADIALYHAKNCGRNRYEYFSEALQAEIIQTKKLADEILGGLERNEFVAHYQMQFDAKTLAFAGAEALARWNHPVQGVLTPDVFLKVAEDLNVVALIDQIVLEQALLDFEDWTKSGVRIPRISVNVSARRLKDEELIKSLSQLAIRPGTVSFELIESIFLDENDDLLIWNVEQIKELGIDIEIDDFGTGYASIVSLMKLKPRRLKIDRQLILPITDSPEQLQVVRSIIEIGKSLGIEVVAEGVESNNHARILRKIGCDLLQGYALGRPMDAEGFKHFAQGHELRAVL